jgi:hypothetical protein
MSLGRRTCDLWSAGFKSTPFQHDGKRTAPCRYPPFDVGISWTLYWLPLVNRIASFDWSLALYVLWYGISTAGGPGVRILYDSPTESVTCDHAEAFWEGTGLTRGCTTTRWVIIAGIILVVKVLIVPQLTVLLRTERDTSTHTTRERHHREAAIRTLLI